MLLACAISHCGLTWASGHTQVGGAGEGPSRNFLDESCNYGPSYNTGDPWGIGTSSVQGVRSYISAWMGNHRVWRWARWGQAGRILVSELDRRAHVELYLRAAIHREEVATIPFPRDGRVRRRPRVSIQAFIGPSQEHRCNRLNLSQIHIK